MLLCILCVGIYQSAANFEKLIMLSYRFQNNNIFASKSASQPRGDGNKGDRFPLYITNIPADIDEVRCYLHYQHVETYRTIGKLSVYRPFL